MAIISDDKLREYFRTELPAKKPYEETIIMKKDNVTCFNNLDRTELKYGEQEKRLLLYATKSNEKVYIQYPGKETVRLEDKKNANDFKPVLVMPDGSVHDDMVFKDIWDIVANIGKNVRGSIDILGTLFLRMAYMTGYQYNDNVPYLCEIIKNGTVVSSEQIEISWYSLSLKEDVIDTLNNIFSKECNGISFEAFIYYNDLLAQNEDCKYFDESNPKRGRINNILSHLTVISFFRDKLGFSNVIDRFNRTGVAPIPINHIADACGELVILKDTRREKMQQELDELIKKQRELDDRLHKAQEVLDEFIAKSIKPTKTAEKELGVATRKAEANAQKIKCICEELL